jgi:hypothetical protein
LSCAVTVTEKEKHMTNEMQMTQLERDGNGGIMGVAVTTVDANKRRRRVWVSSGAIAAALGLALGGGLLASGAEAGASTSPATSGQPPSSTGSAPQSGNGSSGSAAPGAMSSNCSPPAAAGTVTSVGSNSFTLTTSTGNVVTVDVTSATHYRDRGVANASLSNVTVGEHVAVMGTSASGAVNATDVMIGQPLAGPGARPLLTGPPSGSSAGSGGSAGSGRPLLGASGQS